MTRSEETKLSHQNDLIDKLLFWSLCATFFFIPIATSPLEIASSLALAVWVLSGKFIKDRQKWLNQEWTKPVILFMLIPLFGLLWTEDFSGGLDFAEKSYYWLFSFVVASICYKYQPKYLIYAFLAGLTLSVFLAMLQYIGFIPMAKGYPMGFNGPITYNLLLVFGLLLMSFYYSKKNTFKKQRIFIILLIIAYFVNLALVKGRSGHLAFVILSPLMFYNIFQKKSLKKIALVSIVGVIVLFSSSTVQNRAKAVLPDMQKHYSSEAGSGVSQRLYMWEGAIKIFLENPIIGVGTGGYKEAMRTYAIKKYKDNPIYNIDFDQPHNSFLYIASSFGTVGLLSTVWLFVIFFKKGWHARENIVGFAVLSYGLVLFIGSLTDVQIISVATGKMFVLLMGIPTNQDEI